MRNPSPGRLSNGFCIQTTIFGRGYAGGRLFRIARTSSPFSSERSSWNGGIFGLLSMVSSVDGTDNKPIGPFVSSTGLLQQRFQIAAVAVPAAVRFGIIFPFSRPGGRETATSWQNAPFPPRRSGGAWTRHGGGRGRPGVPVIPWRRASGAPARARPAPRRRSRPGAARPEAHPPSRSARSAGTWRPAASGTRRGAAARACTRWS